MRHLFSLLFWGFLALSCVPLFFIALAIFLVTFPFDRDGRVNTDVSDNPYGADDDEARGIAIGTDGKITVAGYADMDGTGYDVLLARYLSTGALDTTFGTGGIVRTDVQVGLDQAFDLALQQDGKVVIAGTSAHGASSDAILARFLAA